MKRTLFTVCICIMQIQLLFAQVPHVLTKDDVVFENGEILDYRASYKNIIIPSRIDGVEVISIGEQAFSSNSLTQVSIPNSVTYIGYRAFNSNSFSSIILPTPEVNGKWNQASSGEEVTNFNTTYQYTSFNEEPYVLKEQDVTLENGIIKDYLGRYSNIVIPNAINGVEIVGIDDMAFHRNSLTKVEISNSVKNIGAYAFSSNSITEVSIPNSVMTIDNGAFNDNDLTEVIIPNSVTSLGTNAFNENTLTSITLPTPTFAGEWNIGSSGSEVSNLSTLIYYSNTTPYELTNEDVDFEDGIIKFYWGKHRNIIIPEFIDGIQVTEIGNSAFSWKSITGLSFPNSITHIGEYAFSGSPITSIELPNMLKYIGKSAFASASLASLEIPNTVIYIGPFAFSHNDIKTLEVPNSVEYIGNSAFQTNTMESVSLSNSLVYIGSGAFAFNTLTSFILPTPAQEGTWNTGSSGDVITDLRVVYEYNISGETYEITRADVEFEKGKIIKYNGTYKEISIPEYFDGEKVTHIGRNAFSNKELVSVSIPNTVIHIAPFAFSNNTLTSFILPTPEEEGYWSTGDSGDEITNFYSTNQYYSSEPYVLTSEDVLIKDGEIKDYFGYHTNITIPETLDGQVVTSIGDGSFNYNKLTSVVLPNSVEKIDEDAFRGNEITNVTLSNTLVSIEDRAFYDNQLIALSIPNSVKTIGSFAFDRNSITDLILSESLTAIDAFAFSDNPISSLSLPSTLISIGESAFENTAITSLVIPNSVVKIGANAFHGDSFSAFILPTPDYEGEWNRGNSGERIIYISAPHYYIEATPHELTSDDIIFKDGKIIDYLGKYSTIIIPEYINGEKVIAIGDYAFENKLLSSVVIPNTVITIGNYAFRYNEITELIIPNSVDFLGEHAFARNDISDLTISESLSIIRERTFEYNDLVDVIVPNSVTVIDNYAFYGNYSLANVTLSNSLTKIGNSAFRYDNLEEITLPASLIEIGSSAFDDNQLTSFSLPTTEYDGFEFDGWLGSDENTYASESNVSNLELSYIAKVTNNNAALIDTYFQGEVVDLVISGDLEKEFKNVKSNNFFVTDGADITLSPKVSPSTGYYIEPVTITVNGDQFIDFILIDNPYSITYHTDGGVHSNPLSYHNKHETFLLEDVIRAGYSFAGWYSEVELLNNVTSIEKGTTGNIDLYAKYTLKEYAITYNAGEGTHDNTVSNYTIDDEDIVLLDASKEGYIFEGWYSDDKYQSKVEEIITSELKDVTLYAKFSPINYSITYFVDGGIHSNEIEEYTVESETITLLDASKEGYIFEGWYSDVELLNRIETIQNGSIGNLSIYAKFNEIYSITYEVDGGEQSNPSEYTITSETITLSEASKESYIFEGWYSDSELTTQITTIATGTTGDLIIYAKYLAIKYDITYEVDGGEHSNPSDYTIESETITLLDASKEGYTFEGWYSDSELTAEVKTIESGSTGDVKLYAKYLVIDYTITFEVDDNTVHSNPESYTTEDDDITLLVASKEGYTFEGWYSDSDLTVEVKTIESGSTGNVMLYPKFSTTSFTITYDLDGGTHENPVNYTVESETIELTGANKTNYIFEGWYSDSDLTVEVKAIENGSTGDMSLYAKYTPITYSITYNSNGGTHENSTEYTVESESITLLKAIKDGYRFDGWYSESEFTTQVTTIETGTTGEIDLYAKYTPITYSITYNSNGGSHENALSYTIESEDIELLDAVKEGYTFEGWYTNSGLDVEIEKIEKGSIGVKTFYAKYTPISYSITYNSNEGTHENALSYTVESENVELLGAVKEGYTFEGWYSESEFTTQVTTIETGTTGELELHAKYTPITYSITYNSNGGTHENALSYTIESEEIELLDAEKEGYTFEGWYTDSDFTTELETINSGTIGELELYAKYTPITYSITYNSDGGSHENSLSYTVESETIELLDAVKEGYAFEGWYSDSDFTTKVTSISSGSTGDVMLYAKYLVGSYMITYFVNEGIHDNPSNYTFSTESILLKDASKYGYTFEGWYSDSDFTTKVEAIESGTTGDLMFYAKFLAITYSITYNTDGGIHNNPLSYTVESELITLENATKEGYDFEGWYSDSQFTNRVEKIMQGETGNVTLYAKYTLGNYTITYEGNGGIHNNPSSYSFNSEAIILEDAVKEGYDFNGWYSDSEFTTEVKEITSGTMGDLVLYAKYSAINYSITYETNGGTHDNPSSFTIESEIINLTEATRDGYLFEGWYSDADFTTEVVEIVSGSIGDLMLYAKWKANDEVTSITDNISQISIYPNPNKGSFKVEIGTSSAQLIITTLSGIQVYNDIVVDQQQIILPNHIHGVLVATLISNNQSSSSTTKIIVE